MLEHKDQHTEQLVLHTELTAQLPLSLVLLETDILMRSL